VFQQIEFLVNHLDPEIFRIVGACGPVVLSSEGDAAGIVGKNPGQNFDERRFAGSVFSNKSMHFPFEEREADAIKCLDAAEVFLQSLNRQECRAFGRLRHDCR